jgi:hypothetical protein
MPDQDGYPTEAELNRIKLWDFHKDGDVHHFLDYLKGLWSYPNRFVWTGKNILRLYLSTGGSSGNESIIEALGENTFWMMCWQKSKRGGHYWFEINLKLFMP